MDPLVSLEHFQTIPLFAKMTDEQRYRLAAMVKKQQYHAGQIVVWQGELANRFIIVHAGAVNLRRTETSGMEKSLGTIPPLQITGHNITPKNFFGEQMFTSQEPYDFTAVAIMETQVFFITRAEFDQFAQAHPYVVSAMTFIADAERQRTRGQPWVDAGEAVALIARKHWWALLPSLIPVAIAVLVVGALTFALTNWHLDNFFAAIPVAWFVVLLFLLFQLYDWQNDEYIVTNRRVAHVERVLLTQHELRESIPIEKVQNVSIVKSGLPGMLGVSSLTVQSGGSSEGKVTFAYVANAADIRKAISVQQDRVRARDAAEERERVRGAIEKELREYMLPQIASRERAAAQLAALKSKPGPKTARQKIRALVDTWLGEEIERAGAVTWRKHWIVLLQQEARWAAAIGALTALLVAYNFVPSMQALPYGSFLLGGIVALLICLGGIWWEWEDWRNDTYAITDSQIVDTERLPFGWKEKSNTAPLDQVQDVRVDVPGPLAFFFDYGDVMIETAGKTGQMIFRSVRYPRLVADHVFKKLEEYRARKVEKDSSVRNRVVIDALVGYHRLQKEEERLLQQHLAAQGASTAPAAPAADASTATDASTAAAPTVDAPLQTDSSTAAAPSVEQAPTDTDVAPAEDSMDAVNDRSSDEWQ